MEVNCEGCAGCCLDWRSLTPDASDHERRGPQTPIDDHYNFVPLSRDDVTAFFEAGYTDALTPRLWADDGGITIDRAAVAAVDGKPVFFIGPRKPPKPVAPFGIDPMWLPACLFLDPTTLQCRIHEANLYPEECSEYPGHNLKLGAETECERVEEAFGGDRLADDTVPETLSGLLLGPQAIGQKVFVHPDPDCLTGIVSRITSGTVTHSDRAEFVAAAVANAPGTTTVDGDRYERVREQALEQKSWATAAVDEWTVLAETANPDVWLAQQVEDDRGAPHTPGWPGEDT